MQTIRRGGDFYPEGTEVMAYYNYECTKCGHEFTDEQTFAEHDKHKQVKCPKCASKRVEQLVSHVYAKTTKKS